MEREDRVLSRIRAWAISFELGRVDVGGLECGIALYLPVVEESVIGSITERRS